MSFTRFGTHNMVLPPEGPKCYSHTLDFTASPKATLDYTQQIQSGAVTQIQGIYVDNTVNNNPLVIVTDQVGQRVVIPANSGAYMPLFISDSSIINFETVVNANLLVRIVVTNVPVTPCVWKV